MSRFIDEQRISCSVKNCAFHTKNDGCDRDGIHVGCCHDPAVRHTPEESMCASYRLRS